MISILYYLTCFIEYLKRTIWLKLIAVAITLVGLLIGIIGDGTAFVLIVACALAVFFADPKYMESYEEEEES